MVHIFAELLKFYSLLWRESSSLTQNSGKDNLNVRDIPLISSHCYLKYLSRQLFFKAFIKF